MPTYQPMYNLHQQIPSPNQFSNYGPPRQTNYTESLSNQAKFNPHSMYSSPPSQFNQQQPSYLQRNTPPPISQNVQQQSFVHNLPTPSAQQTVSPSQEVSSVQSNLQSNTPIMQQTNSPLQQSNFPASQSVVPPNQQQQPNYSFTTPLNLPGMPPLNVSIDNSKIPLNNVEFETIINNKN